MHRHTRLSLPIRILATTLLSATARAADPATNAVAAADTAFALDLYHQLAAAPGNLFFSPYSLSRLLALAAAGARGPTATELDAALHLDRPADQLAAGYADLTKALQAAAGDDIDLVTADSLWVQNQYPLRPEYLQTVRIQFGADAMPADFVHNTDAARAAINSWVGTQTRGKIPELIGPGVLNAATRVVLCDAIYFKGKWEHQFKPQQTDAAPFRVAGNAIVSVPTMHQTSVFRSVHLAGVGLLELPYLGQRYSMVVILPDAVDGLAGVEQQLTAEQLHLWLAQLDPAGGVETAVYLPRFTARQNLQLAAQLQHLGLSKAFDPAAADFSGMTGNRDLFLSEVLHQAFVNVDEEGTEAAAASAAVMLGMSMAKVPEFRVDHPFLFLIRDNATGTILFLGRVTDPR